MMRLSIYYIVGLLLIVGPTANAKPTPPQSAHSSKELIQALQQGGYVIYMRHAATERSQKDSVDGSFDDCSKQRNLSEKESNTVKELCEIEYLKAKAIISRSSNPDG